MQKKERQNIEKKDKTSRLFIQNIRLDLKNNPIKRRQRISKKQNHNVLTSNNYKNNRNNYSTFDQINIRFSEKQIYEIAIKINKHTDLELNSLSYKDAIKIDKRTYCIYYLSLIRTNHLLFFSFMRILDYNSPTLEIFLFFSNLVVNLLAKAFF